MSLYQTYETNYASFVPLYNFVYNTNTFNISVSTSLSTFPHLCTYKHLNVTKPLGLRPPLRKMLYLVSFVELSNFDIDIVISNISMYASRHFQQGECASWQSCVDI